MDTYVACAFIDGDDFEYFADRIMDDDLAAACEYLEEWYDPNRDDTEYTIEDVVNAIGPRAELHDFDSGLLMHWSFTDGTAGLYEWTGDEN